ncbi:MAG: PaaI family thioesterase [Acidobacteriia bacterium]|nr:PaaI family thioesterase [Terriglobia bacterium]
MNKKRQVTGHVHHKHPVLKQHPALRKNYCFGCGQDNPEGMRLKFVHDEQQKRFVAHFRLGRRFTGPPRHAHGGIIAVILDEAMSKPSKLRNVLAPTVELTVRYLKPVPLGEKLTASGWEVRVRGREHLRAAEIRNDRGELLAMGRGKFKAVDADRMMQKFLQTSVPGSR